MRCLDFQRVVTQVLLVFGAGSVFGLALIVGQAVASLRFVERGPQEAIVLVPVSSRFIYMPSQGFAVGVAGLAQALFPGAVQFGGASADARPYALGRRLFGGGAGSLLGRRLAALQDALLLLQACVILLEAVEFVFECSTPGA